jgi:adenylate kinase
MSKVAAVFGLSGVGKSWLISRYAAANAVMHIQASRVLQDAKATVSGAAVSSEELRTGAVLDNQQLLITGFATVRANAVLPIIFDGHCVIDSGSRLVEIPVDVIRLLSVSGLVFVRSCAQDIVEKRRGDKTRVRPLRTPAEILAHQQRAISLCEEYASHLHLDLYTVEAGDEERFATAIDLILNDERS